MAEESDSVRAFERFKDLERAMRESEGWRLNADRLRLARSYRVFMGNDDELIGFLEENEETSAMLALWDV
ncbi:MAG TPA: hypothetical protein VMR48_02070, partial [Gaiellaceae bacterium]|nr:hypothetical protein [Gaiellaceae bacterium]